MNFKKGFWRFFLVSSIAIFIYGYFIGANQANNSYRTQNDITRLAIADLDKPICQEAIKDNPKKLPEWSLNTPNPCSSLALKYEYAKALHDKERRMGQVTPQDFEDEFGDTWGNYRIRTGSFNGVIATIGYWAFLAVALIAFITLRWVYQGFKK